MCQGNLWELLSKTSKIINPEAQYDIYEKSSYAELKEYEKIRQKELQDLIAFTDGADENSDFILALARASADFWLRHTYQDGRINSIAQTRTATSYGFLQPRYTTAVEKKYGYPKDASHRPEDLQIPEIVFKYAVPYLTIQLKEVLDTQNDNDISNWNLGWEKTWKIALSKYNNPSLDGISGYGIDVINKSSSYKPH